MIKKLLPLTASFVVLAASSIAQTNLNFEQWTGNTPSGWSAPLANFASGSVAKETTAPGEGSASVKLTTATCSVCGIVGLPDPVGGIIQQQVPFNAVINSVDVMLKSDIPAGDTATFILQTYSGFDAATGSGNIVGISGYRIPGGLGATSWEAINLPYQVIDANLTVDTLLIAGASSDGLFFDNRNGITGGVLYIDGIIINTPLGAKEVAPVKRTIVSPNPASNSIFFFTSNQNLGSTLTLTDALGRVIYTQEITSVKEQIDISSFIQGVYFYELNKKDGTKDAGKFIITK